MICADPLPQMRIDGLSDVAFPAAGFAPAADFATACALQVVHATRLCVSAEYPENPAGGEAAASTESRARSGLVGQFRLNGNWRRDD